MSTTTANDNVDYRLLGLMSDLVICSACLRQGCAALARRRGVATCGAS